MGGTLVTMLLKITVFISGASIMILEIVGARVLAPYLGTSIIVWTSLLGAVMVSLSVGYFFGGKIADKKSDYKILSLIIFLSGVAIGATAAFKSSILLFVQPQIVDIRWASLIGAFLLFAPANILLGAVSPYSVKLQFSDPKYIGSTVGTLYAISTIGSIVGTYATGFFLLSYFGNTNLLFSLASLLVFLSLVVYPDKVKTKCLVVLIFSLASFANSELKKELATDGFIDIDTDYNRAWITESFDSFTGRPVRSLSTGARYIQSVMFIDGDDLVVEYTKFFNLADYYNSNIRKALMVGGGAYSYPKNFLANHKNAEMDVIEIDPGLTRLAKKFFNLNDSPRLKIFHEDGRVFLNRTQNKYDAVFIDAFASSIPFHLTTKEFVAEVFDHLNENGVVVMNTIGSMGGNTGKFIRAEYATYKLFSDLVYIFPVQGTNDSVQIQNLILVAVKSDKKMTNDSPKFEKYFDNLWAGKIDNDTPVLTDDFAPVDQYLADVF